MGGVGVYFKSVIKPADFADKTQGHDSQMTSYYSVNYTLELWHATLTKCVYDLLIVDFTTLLT